MVSSVPSKRNYLTLILLDIIAMLGFFLVAYSIRFGVTNIPVLLNISLNGNVFAVVFLIVFFNLIFDLYEVKYWFNNLFSPIRILLSAVFVAITMSLSIYLFAAESSAFIGRGVLLGALSGYLVYSFVLRYWIQQASRKRVADSYWLIVGGEDFRVEFEKECHLSGFNVRYEWLDRDDADISKNLAAKIQANSLSGIVICGLLDTVLAQPLMGAKFNGVQIYDFQFFFERVWGKVAVRCLRPGWFIFNHRFTIVNERLNARFKQALDLLGSLFLLILTSPIMLLAILIIRLESEGHPIYKQKRVGFAGSLFTIYKLRSMCVDAEVDGAIWAKENDSRVTRFGSFMRATRIDELPQLINILKGEMSFVGPRPERPEFTSMLEKEIPYYNLRHMVKPGLTGWAQVAFSYGASKEESLQKLQYELFYIKNHSIWLDMVIIFKTFMVVLLGRGR